jgi:RNA polymerase sigma-70 factor, ECF subfamily
MVAMSGPALSPSPAGPRLLPHMVTPDHDFEVPGAGEPAATDNEMMLVEALRRGDESAFIALVDLYHPTMIRLAGMYVADRTLAEEVAQEAWLGVLRGISRFEGRSSLKTWLFRILTNRAKTRAEREGRTVPFSSLVIEIGGDEPAVDPDRFLDRSARYEGHWATKPASWGAQPEERLLSSETRSVIAEAVAALPPSQREVITLRDIEGWGATEVCNVCQISESNQRVLLHRARSKVRRAIERYFDEAHND